jgi:hypothetical protein
MKSAYGLKVPEPDYELASVGPGTPCGELLRYFCGGSCGRIEITSPFS